jgi:NADPH2:quinone reductase
MVKAIVVREFGGPDAMKLEDVALGEPGPGEARVKHAAIGLNFVDVYNRTGLYKPPGGLPFTPGAEGAGTVVSVGVGVTHVKPGDRVSYSGAQGSYAEERIIAADRLIKVPDEIDFKTAAAMTLKGLTVQFLLRQTFPVKKGDTILFHAAAGGVGSIAGQWANHLGATVIGTVGSDEKAKLAKARGYHHVINYKTENFVERVAEITGGKKCDAVYDSVGRDTYPGSLDCLRPMGMWVLFGQSSGVIQNFDMNILAQKGSLFTTRPTLFTYAAKRDALEKMAAELMDVVKKGIVKIEVKQEFPLAKAADAHRALEGRQTSGATVLVP